MLSEVPEIHLLDLRLERFITNSLQPGLDTSHVRRFKLQAWEYYARFAFAAGASSAGLRHTNL
jgi:hypothetical protein